MLVTYTFAGLPVADYGDACEWYVHVLGRQADMFPHDTEAVWRLTPNGAIYVVQDPARAGSGLLTVALDDLAAYERRLREAGLAFEELAGEGAPRRLSPACASVLLLKALVRRDYPRQESGVPSAKARVEERVAPPITIRRTEKLRFAGLRRS